MLQQFNVVVTGDVNSTSHVDGRSYVGGNVVGGDYVQHVSDTPASAYAGLTVGGKLSGNVHVNGLGMVVGGDVQGVAVNSGESYIGGNASSSSLNGNAWVVGSADGINFGNLIHAASYNNMNLNGKVLGAPTATMNSTLAAATSTNFGNVMTGLSSQLAALHGTDGASVDFSNSNHKVTFSGTAVNGVLVFDLTTLDSQVFSSTTAEFDFNLHGASTVIFNTNDKNLSVSANFLGGSAQALGSKLIWNFAGAESVTIGATFGGQMLVANGTLNDMNHANVEGGVFAKALNQTGEIHLQSFSGTIPTTPVPEPETYAMLLAGLGLVGALARRRKQ
ncbi:choice-of-anchor A family protein [Pseudoduganella danionis]|uniref:Choice-of-anchor A family protein n=2 Tax=Pseudoduganella danionis TaxID=1890295 RepID=A0ABW9SQS5_9BURK|nr:choice-of-anchor A family protein [Pseudoduganella danionis]